MGKFIVRRPPPNVVGVGPGVLAWAGVDPTPLYLPAASINPGSIAWQGADPHAAAAASSDVGALAYLHVNDDTDHINVCCGDLGSVLSVTGMFRVRWDDGESGGVVFEAA